MNLERPPIIRRRVDIDFGQLDDGRWTSGGAYFEDVLNVVSYFFPVGEKYFIDSVRYYEDQITDPVLKTQVKDFIYQEAMHTKQHIRSNRVLNQTHAYGQAIAKISEVFLYKTRWFMPKATQLAVSCAIEHYIARYFKPQKMVGLDYSPSAVELSQHIHQGIENLSFVEGDAENLPFEDASFDVIVNVESSHCYSNMAAFVAEVERVLKPGGYFVWSDFRKSNTGEQTQIDHVFQRPGLKPIHQEDITPNVVKALDSANDQKLAMISSIPLFKNIFREFAGTKGSAIYNGMKSGDVSYMSKRFVKTSV